WRYLRDGSATPMRGKSLTFRQRVLHLLRVSDPSFAVIDRKILESEFGKSETCRASEWPSQNDEASHWLRSLTIKSPTCRASEWPSQNDEASHWLRSHDQISDLPRIGVAEPLPDGL